MMAWELRFEEWRGGGGGAKRGGDGKDGWIYRVSAIMSTVVTWIDCLFVWEYFCLYIYASSPRPNPGWSSRSVLFYFTLDYFTLLECVVWSRGYRSTSPKTWENGISK